MDSGFPLSQFYKRFTEDNSCFNEIIKIKYFEGIKCPKCKKVTKFYKLNGRPSYTCKICRTQIQPLVGTIFEKSTTPLSLWFYAIYLLTQTKAGISIRALQQELGVTYKTAWRMYKSIVYLMQQNDSDLLRGGIKISSAAKGKSNSFRWTLFNTLVISLENKREESDTRKQS